MRDLIGDDLAGKVRVEQNLSRRREHFTRLGVTRRGTPVLINKAVTDADLTIVIGTVASHYFSGWGGGRKMILPGASHVDSTWANHKLTLTRDGGMNPMCGSGILDGNPVHEDMVEAVGFLDNLFSINVVLDGWAGTAGINAGHIITSHLAAIEHARRLLEIPVAGKCSLAIVSAGGNPLDIDFIQSHKSIDHAAGCILDGGVMIAVAECTDGMASETFLPWFDTCDSTAVCKRLLEDYELNGHTALSLMKKLERFKIFLVSSIRPDIIERTGMTPVESLEEALSQAGALVGEDALTYVFPCAWGILPVV
jgi:nickel-dependent lactate racemase